MSLKLYDDISDFISKKFTNKYSTSFSLGIYCFAKEFRQDIYNIYGFVRLADEIVDTFTDVDKKYMLQNFREDTFLAIRDKMSLNPILYSFQKTVNAFSINHDLIDAFLNSMEMDLTYTNHTKDSFDKYIYGSAEVVGLMCLKVFCKNDEKLFDTLSNSALKLGSAFQKVNFLRDIKSDKDLRGRVYLPDISKSEITDFDKLKLEKEIETEFQIARDGILKLPKDFRFGVYTSYIYYRGLFKKIKDSKLTDLYKERIRISNFVKILLLIRSYIEIKVMKIKK